MQWHEGQVRVRASVVLPAADAAEDALPSMLSSLFQSFAAMQVPTSLSCVSLQVPAGFSASMALLTSSLEPSANDQHPMHSSTSLSVIFRSASGCDALLPLFREKMAQLCRMVTLSWHLLIGIHE